MTVKELISELQKHPDDAKVIIEGCDCYGDANGVEKFDSPIYKSPPEGGVLITREP